MSRHIALFVAVLVAATGCVPIPGGTKPTATAAKKPNGTSPTSKDTPARPPALAPTATPQLPAGVLTRTVAQTGETSQLTGKVKLISDHGASLISNHGGGIIANNSGGIIANNSGGIIANNGGAVIANHGGSLTANRKLAQAGEAPESTLVDATVFVQDATGRALVDAANKPLAAVSDGQGGFKIQATLPSENLVLKVRLWNGGELSAILPRGGTGPREVAIDTAATLGASYVLNQFVKGDQATFDKLPASEVERLRRDLDAARGLIGQTPDYTSAGLDKLTDELRAKAPAVDQTLTEIKALLLGQANLGGGRQATDVPLADPRATVPDGAGFLVAEGVLGRIRRVAPDGTITTYVDQLHGEVKHNFYATVDMARAADGTLFVLSGKAFGVTRVKPDGTVEDVAGTGLPGRSAAGKPGTEVTLRPWTLCLDPDGTLWIGEDGQGDEPPRILALGPDGILREPAPAAWGRARVVGLARATDGALYAFLDAEGRPDELWRLAPGQQAWAPVQAEVHGEKQSDLAADPAGGLIVTEDQEGRVVHLGLDGVRRVISDAAAGSPIERPTDVWPLSDGRLRVIDGGGIRVYEIAKDGTIKAVAGTGALGADAAGDAIALNGPFGAAYSPDGVLHISEMASHTVNRWDGKELKPLAGSAKGFAGDGGPAAAARFDTPTGLIFRGDELLLHDQGNRRIRAIAKDGTIRTVAGNEAGQDRLAKGVGVPGSSLRISDGAYFALAADDTAYFTAMETNQVIRLSPAGEVTLVAGMGSKGGSGDGGEAGDAKLSTPLGLAFGPDGHLYLADCANMRIRRIRDAGGAKPMIEAYAGVDGAAGIALLGTPPAAGEKLADAAFAFPSALCFDKAGNLYVAEFGTLSLRLLAGLSPGVRELPLDLLPKVAARIRKIAPDGTVSVVAGPGSQFFGDPEAGDALVLPTGLTIDPQGRLVIVDGGANLIRFLPAGAY